MITSDKLIQLTKDMVAIPSIATTKSVNGEFNENILADYIHSYFLKHNIESNFIPTPDGRKCVYVFKKGSTKKTIVLLGHLDTVGIEDYEGVDPFETKGADDSFMYGRGSGDMKSGIAVGMELLREVWNQDLQTNIIFIVAPDEENASEGVIAAGKFLRDLKQKEQLEYLGLINLDCGLEDPTSKTRSIVLGGTVGKLLPCFYVVGRSAHASDPFEGISSNNITSEIIRALDANAEYSDTNSITGEITPPPTCLKAVDLKDSYDVQLPIKSFLYFNYLTFEENPKQVLKKMTSVAEKALTQALKKNREKYEKFLVKQNKPIHKRTWDEVLNVYSYEEIEQKAKKHNPNLQKEIEKIVEKTQGEDPRDRNVKVVSMVATYAKLTTPYIICFFSPPYYPSSYAGEVPFIQNIKGTLNRFSEKENVSFNIKAFSEGISDMNYMQMDTKALEDAKLYTKNSPLSQTEKEVDLDIIADISMPITQIGTYALYPHHKDEKVEIEYTFSILPKLLKEVILSLQNL